MSLEKSVVDVIVNAVNLRHVKREDISRDTPLLGSGLQLDSLDVLEIVVAIEKHFKVKIDSADQGKEVFQTIGTITDFVQSKQTTH